MAASYISVRARLSPHREIRPQRSMSPDWYRRGVKPKCAPTARDRENRFGSSTVLTFSNRAAFVKPCCIYFARVTVLYAVGIGRRNIWSGPEAQVLQGPQRVCARGAPKAPYHAVTYTLARGRQ